MKTHKLDNFIPINRRLFQHQLWCEERAFSRFEAWIYLLKEARFEDTKVYDGNRPVEVKRGQVYVSVRFLAKAFGWTTKKTLGFINLLRADGMVYKEIVEETGQMRITICNYDFYNASGNAKETPRKQQGNTVETKSNRVNKDNRENTATSSRGEMWRENYDVFVNEGKQALDGLLADVDFIAGREVFRPNLNISLSLQKAYEDYWQTRKAWANKRKQKGELDWRMIFSNALDIPQNWVVGEGGNEDSAKFHRQNVDNEINKAKFGKSM